VIRAYEPARDYESLGFVPSEASMPSSSIVNRSATEPLRLVIFYVSDPDTPFLDLAK
jgi:hypothetical protein